MIEKAGRQLVTIQKACALVGVSRRTMYNWIKLDRVEYERTSGGNVRIYVDSLWKEKPPLQAAEVK